MSMTTNEPSVVDESAFTVSRTIRIAASIDKVWAAVTEAEHLAQWFPNSAVLASTAVGATGSFTWDDYGTFPVRIEAVEAPTMIAYRWGNDNTKATTLDEDRSTVFTFTLTAIDGGTQLTVVESGFDHLTDPFGSLESNRSGWNSELDELVAYVESLA